ncbi:MAG: hypothetical protein IT516_00980 [Burkholderiales bacterium]|nr:hypothetical protein [Burkholderiales bacterium]
MRARSKVKQSRIRWTAEERAALVAQCVALRSQGWNKSVKELVDSAQAVLPAPRRRTVYPSLVSWMNRQLSVAGVRSAKPGRNPSLDRGFAPPPAAAMIDGHAAPIDGVATALESALVARCVRAGATIVAGILRDRAVHEALSGLLSAATASAPVPSGDGAAAPAKRGKRGGKRAAKRGRPRT